MILKENKHYSGLPSYQKQTTNLILNIKVYTQCLNKKLILKFLRNVLVHKNYHATIQRKLFVM